MNTILSRSTLRVLAAFLACTGSLLSGCGSLSTGASMRVEVEVYKGPLSKEPEVQLGEVFGLVDELCRSLGTYDASLFRVVDDLPRPGKDKPLPRGAPVLCEGLLDATGPAAATTAATTPTSVAWCEPYLAVRDAEDNEACHLAAQLHDDVVQLQISAQGVMPTSAYLRQTVSAGVQRGSASSAPGPARIILTPHTLAAATEAAKLATQLKLKAMYRVESDAVTRNRNRRLRTLSTGFINLTSEFANQIGSRADAWLKQANTPAKYLQQSVYLRDSAPTDAVNLYIWNRAAAPALLQDFLLQPVGTTLTTEEVTSRVRGIERIFADGYWSNINTVYASGQGEVSMALIKDDIGNWNLKSFSSDPTRLLQAYRDAGVSLIRKAAEFASSGSGLPLGKKVLDLGNSLALGTSPDDASAAGAPMLTKMRELTRARIRRVASDLQQSKGGITETAALQYVARILEDHETAIREMASSSRTTAAVDPASSPALSKAKAALDATTAPQ